MIRWSESVAPICRWFTCIFCGLSAVAEGTDYPRCPRHPGPAMHVLGHVPPDTQPITAPEEVRGFSRIEALQAWFNGLNVAAKEGA